MANKRHLEILKSGVSEWNSWRKSSLERIVLTGADLVGADLHSANLVEADLSKANLSEAILIGANLGRASLSETKLVGTNLGGANLKGANLGRASIMKANLMFIEGNGANLAKANLQGANLVRAALGRADLQGANLVEANLQSAFLVRALLEDTLFVDADLSRAGLGRANFKGADLRCANLSGSFLEGADLGGADLRGANFAGALLAQANVSGRFDEALGLTQIEHSGPSAISSEALEWAQGKLPDEFLKGIGFKDWEVLNAKLHDPNLRPDEVIDIGYEIINLRTKGPLQVNTLFISYARVDSDFVEFLEKKLDDDGIRSWRDVHDMVAGPVQPQIERAIDLNGTVLLVLSRNSLGSDWVEWEVQKARDLQKRLESEGKRDTHVLCPVAIDDAWRDSKWSGPLINQLLKYNILDFSKWEGGEAVERVYAKLKAGIAKYYSDFGDSDGDG